jgi:hypothetical protein
MLAATFIAMFFIPLFYRLVSKRASKRPMEAPILNGESAI